MTAYQLLSFRRKIAKALANVEKMLATTRENLLQVAQNQSRILVDQVDHAKEEMDLNTEMDLNAEYVAERNRLKGALNKIKVGTFGICDDCGEDIGSARLRVHPSASLCIDCQTREEVVQQRHSSSLSRRPMWMPFFN